MPEGVGKVKTVYDIMEENDAYQKAIDFRMRQNLPYAAKIEHAKIRVREWIETCVKEGASCHVSVGGLDSITLLCFIRNEGYDVPAISVSRLEDKSIQRIHKELGVISLAPARREDGSAWKQPDIIREFGFPVLSKEIAAKIELLQNASEKNATVRHAIITGETGAYGGNRTGSRMKLSQKWLDLFAGYENENEGVNYKIAPFKVSSKCCYYLKEKPCDDWAKEHNSYPFLGLMASEGGRREKSLVMHGCNYWGKSTKRSCPFAIFDRRDLLQLALDLNVPIPEIYGEIARDKDGNLYTTKAQRTGCSMCGFGIHLEKRPHRFDRLRERNYKEWDFYMNHLCKDESGNEYGWGMVLDYIGVGWRDVPLPRVEQISIFD